MTPFLRPRPVADPAIRLVVFHHAGGSASAYYPLLRGISSDWDLLLIDLPGRGRRHREAPLEQMSAVVGVVIDDVLAWAEAPLALFGHSLGAVVAVEVARALQGRGVRPIWVGVSGRPAPGHRGETAKLSHDVSDEELLRSLTELGGVPDRIDDVPEFRAQMLRLVRSDLRAVESYAPAPDRVPVAAPLTAFGGTDDPLAPPAAIAAWQDETSEAFAQRLFPGGHFHFLGSAFVGFTSAIVAEIRQAMGSAPATASALTSTVP